MFNGLAHVQQNWISFDRQFYGENQESLSILKHYRSFRYISHTKHNSKIFSAKPRSLGITCALLAAMLPLSVVAANAETLSLDCQVKIVTSNLDWGFHLEVDDNGLAYISMGEVTYFTNSEDKFFRKNNYEIAWGHKANATGSAAPIGNPTINRNTGEYVSYVGNVLWQKGVCTKGNTMVMPNKL
jgi:hypothetical protein